MLKYSTLKANSKYLTSTVASISIEGGRNLRPLKNKGGNQIMHFTSIRMIHCSHTGFLSRDSI